MTARNGPDRTGAIVTTLRRPQLVSIAPRCTVNTTTLAALPDSPFQRADQQFSRVLPAHLRQASARPVQLTPGRKPSTKPPGKRGACSECHGDAQECCRYRHGIFSSTLVVRIEQGYQLLLQRVGASILLGSLERIHGGAVVLSECT